MNHHQTRAPRRKIHRVEDDDGQRIDVLVCGHRLPSLDSDLDERVCYRCRWEPAEVNE